MKIDWTSVCASGITASVICCFQFFTTRYLARILNHLEKKIGTAANNGSLKDGGKRVRDWARLKNIYSMF
jgi:hypothetical protein